MRADHPTTGVKIACRFTLDTRQWEISARAHRDIIAGQARPVLSFIGCANFWHPDILVEVAIKAYRAP